jgi:hypothetical protein
MKNTLTALFLLAGLVTQLSGYIIVCTSSFPPIPEIELEAVPLIDGIAFLRQKTQEIDDFEPDPERKGIRFVFDEDRLTPGDLAKPVTVRGKNLLVEDILAQMTTQTGTAFVVLRNYILITSIAHAKELPKVDQNEDQPQTDGEQDATARTVNATPVR